MHGENPFKKEKVSFSLQYKATTDDSEEDIGAGSSSQIISTLSKQGEMNVGT